MSGVRSIRIAVLKENYLTGRSVIKCGSKWMLRKVFCFHCLDVDESKVIENVYTCQYILKIFFDYFKSFLTFVKQSGRVVPLYSLISAEPVLEMEPQKAGFRFLDQIHSGAAAPTQG